MGFWACARPDRPALDGLLAGGFVLLDTTLTLAGTSWWPAHPGALAWALLVVQGLADAALVFRRRAPLLVIAILAGFSLVVGLLIAPAGLITPENAGNVWAPFGTVLAAYGPFFYGRNQRDRRVAFAAVGTLTLIVARVWDPSTSALTRSGRCSRSTSPRGTRSCRACATGPNAPSRSATCSPSRPGPKNASGSRGRCTTS
jgi:hypothetical protein